MLYKPQVAAFLHIFRRLSQITSLKAPSKIICPPYIHLSDSYLQDESNKAAQDLLSTITVTESFLSESEEKSILDEIEPYLKRLHYEFDHWDDAIHGYRETERLQWNTANTILLNRVRELAFPPSVAHLKHVHVLDLDKKGYIKPHIDATRFCGNTIAGLSLLSDSVMRLVHNTNKSLIANILLKRRSLYIMKDTARFDYTHEILKDEESIFAGKPVPRERRISVICRNEPRDEDTQ